MPEFLNQLTVHVDVLPFFVFDTSWPSFPFDTIPIFIEPLLPRRRLIGKNTPK